MQKGALISRVGFWKFSATTFHFRHRKEQMILIVNPETCIVESKKIDKFWVSLENDAVIVTNSSDSFNKFEDLKLIEVVEPQDETPVALSALMKTDFKGITQIDVRFGDGNKLAIIDTKSLEDISSKLKRIELVRANDKRTIYGSLYGMELTMGITSFSMAPV
jgi:hypothetical protein